MINLYTTATGYELKLNGQPVSENRKLDIVEITFQERVGYTSKIDVVFRDSEEFDLTANELKLGTSLELSLGWKGNRQLLFFGHIGGVAPTFADNEVAEIKLTAYDLSYLMKKPKSPRFNIGKSMFDVVQVLLKDYQKQHGMEYVIKHPDNRLQTWKLSDEEGQAQQDDTDFEILTWIAERCGYELSVRNKKIYFVDPEYFAREQGDNKFTFYYRPTANDLDDDSGLVIYGFEPENKIQGQRTRIQVVSWSSVDTSGVKRGEKKLEQSSKGQVNFTEIKVETNVIETLVIQGEAAQSAAAAKLIAESELERRAQSLVKGQASMKGWPALRVGQQHNLKLRAMKTIGQYFSGEYRITGIEHRWNQGGFKTSFDVSRDTLNKTD